MTDRFSFKNKYFLLSLLVIAIYIFSFIYKFLDPFVVGTWWAPSPGGDFYSVPRSFINLLYEKSIFDSDFFPYGDHSARYFFHPILSVILGSWLMLFPPVVSFYIFVALSVVIIIYCGTLINEIFRKNGKEYILLICSVGTYLMLWNAQMHVFVLLSITLILNGLFQNKMGNLKLCNKRIMLGILASLFSKPVIILSFPYLLLQPQIRKSVLKAILIYIIVSIIFLLNTRLNPAGDNWIHWKNIIWQSTTADTNAGIFSISWLIVAITKNPRLSPGIHYFLKIPFLFSLIPIVAIKKINQEDVHNYCLLGFLLTTISYYLSYTVVWEYHYVSLLPVIIFMLWSDLFVNRKIIIASFLIISMPLIYQGDTTNIFEVTNQLVVGKSIKIFSVFFLYLLVFKKIYSLQRNGQNHKKVKVFKDERGFNQIFINTVAAKVRMERRCDYMINQMDFKSLSKHSKILEIGCGTGEALKYISDKTGAICLGVDLSRKFINTSNENYKDKNLSYRLANFNDPVTFEAQIGCTKFDYIIGNGILHHLYYNLDDSLVNIYKLLNPKGKIIFIEPNVYNPYVALIFKIPYFRKKMFLEPDEMAFSPRFIKKKLKGTDFSTCSVEIKDFLLPNIPDKQIGIVIKIGALLEKTPITIIAQSLFITATK